MAGRTMTLSHRGTTATVKEGFDDECVIEVDGQVIKNGGKKQFPTVCGEALRYLIDNAGSMKGSYERKTR